jgi:acetate kinase
MGSRSGDLDPAILLHVMAKEELGAAELNALLNKHSGLIGVSGLSNDMRKLLEAEAAGNERAKLAVDVFCYRLRKYIASYVGVLGGVDALVFTGGIGENAPAVRARSVEGLSAMGIAIDPALNEAARGREADIAPVGNAGRVQVIPTNEELLIARDTYRIVRGLPLA